MVIAFVSDKLQHRLAFTIIPMLISMAGLGILLNVHGEDNTDIQYGALFLVTAGCYSAMPVVVCWFAMNLGGHRRRSVGTAWQVGFGNSEFTNVRPYAAMFSTTNTKSKSAGSSLRILSLQKTRPIITSLVSALVFLSLPSLAHAASLTSWRFGIRTDNGSALWQAVTPVTLKKMESVWETWRQSSAMRIDLSSETKSFGSFEQVVIEPLEAFTRARALRLYTHNEDKGDISTLIILK
jgi:hypothetical protein